MVLGLLLGFFAGVILVRSFDPFIYCARCNEKITDEAIKQLMK